MPLNPFAGVPAGQLRGLQLTNGKAAATVLKKAETIGVKPVLGRKISKTPTHISVKPTGDVIKPKRTFAAVQPLMDAQRNVTTVRAGAGAQTPTKFW